METSYQGVSFSAEQLSILTKDLAEIDKYQAQLNQNQARLNSANAAYNSAVAINCGSNSVLDGGAYESCMATREQSISNANLDVQQRQADVASSTASLAAAKKNYNDDLNSIQDQIKLQIQASLATSQASTQASQNQVTLNQNDPRLLLQKAEAEAAAKLKALELQSTLDRQKRDQQVKIVGFVIVGALVVAIGWYVIKKLL